MTVILDWKDADWTVPKPSAAQCTMCGTLVHPPFVHWYCPGDVARDKSILLCAHCCHWYRRGLMDDMRRADAINEGLNPSPDCLTLRTQQ